MIKKIITALVFIAVLYFSVIPAFAAVTTVPVSNPEGTQAQEVKESLLILVGKPEIELTEYDVVTIRVYAMNSGKSYSFDLYGYNNFSDNFMMPEGDYLITEISVKDRSDLVLLNKKPEFTIKGTTSLIVPITNSLIIAPPVTTEPPTTQEATYYNPFEPQPNTGAVPNSNTSEQPSEDESASLPGNVSVPGKPEQSSNDQATESETEDGEQNSKNIGSKIVILIVVLALIAGIASVIIIRKRVNEE